MASIPPILPTPNGVAISSFGQFTAGDNNVPNAYNNYLTFLTSGDTIAPLGVRQIGPFAFDYEGDDLVSQDSEITDHFVEDNVAVQDHIGVRPVMITLKGIVSDLTFSANIGNTLLASLTSVENTLSQADAYLGKYTPGVTQTLISTISRVQSVAVQIEQAASRTAQIASFLSPQGSQQQKAYAVLSSLQLARILFTVFTPFQVFTNMVIEHFEIIQPAKIKTQSNVTVRMKQLQFVNSLSVSAFTTQFGGRATAGFQPSVSQGITSGIASPITAITNAFKSATSVVGALGA